MPYATSSGGYERASRLGHTNAIVRAMADKASFFVPAERIRDLSRLSPKIRSHADLLRLDDEDRLTGAIGVDGSVMVVPVRDGLPSVRYGYGQVAAVWLDLDAMESQRQERFVDPVALNRTINSALVSYDLPVAGAYLRARMSIQDSWRESIWRMFQIKKVEVNRFHQSLLQLLLLLHGRPGNPATSLSVDCPHRGCRHSKVAVGAAGADCPSCGGRLFPTDMLRIFEEVVEDATNQEPLGRLTQVVELLVVVGLATLLWEQSRDALLRNTLFAMDGPMAIYGPPAKLRARALEYFQQMSAATLGAGPHLCGIEKTGIVVDYARTLARHEVLKCRELLIMDHEVIAAITNANNPTAYGSETYWGRKFIYRATDGRVVVFTVLPRTGPPYDDHGGQPEPAAYPSLPAILDVIDRTGSSMYRDGIIPTVLAHSKAAYPIGVGTDVLRLVAQKKLGISERQSSASPEGR